MKLNKKLPQTSAAVGALKFVEAKKIMKNDLRRLEKSTTAQAPTTFFMEGMHTYPDKKDVALPFIGKANTVMKSYGKLEVAKMETGVLGRVYFNGLNSDGQKIIVFDVAKGKGKQKIAKLEKGLKKLVAQSTYQLVFNEVAENAYDELETKLDAMPDIAEEEDNVDYSDEGDVEVDKSQNYDQLLQSNLVKLSTQFGNIKTKLATKSPVDKDDFELLYDYAVEWLELHSEADAMTQAKYVLRLPQVTEIRDFAQNRLNGNTTIVAKGFEGLQEGQSLGVSDPTTLNQIFQTSQNFEKKGLCAEASRAMLYKYLDMKDLMTTDGSISIGDGSANNDVDKQSPYFVDGMNMGGEKGKGTNYYPILKEGKGNAHDKSNYTVDVSYAQKALKYIEYHLSQQPAIPVMVGVSYKDFAKKGGEKYNELTTDHFILLVGMRKKGGVGEYFYLDPGTQHKSVGTDISANSMLQDAKNPFLFIDPKSAIGGGSPFFLSSVAKFAKDRNNNNWEKEWDEKNGVIIENPQDNPNPTPNPSPNPNPTPNPTPSATTITSTIGKGSTGAEAKLVQELLLKAGYALPKYGADADFGSESINALSKFQKDKGLTVSGTIAPDSDTWKALNGLPYNNNPIPNPNNNSDNPIPTPSPSDNKTYNSAFKAAEFAKTLHQQEKYWIDVRMTEEGAAFYKLPDKIRTKKYPSKDHATTQADFAKGYIKKNDKGGISVASTWCNQLAYALGDEILGEANPFNMLPMGEGMTRANQLQVFMDKADGVLVDKISGEGRFAKAWAEINKGKMVYFCSYNHDGGSGHVATGIPTPVLQESKYAPNDKVGKVTQAGSVVGEYFIDKVWYGELKNVKIYVGRFQEPLPNNAKPDPNLHLAMYKEITHPIGEGKVMGKVGSLVKTFPNDDERQNVIASIRTVQQLLVNAGQNIKVDGDCGAGTVQAIKNIQIQIQQPPTGFVAMNDATWQYLMGKSAPLIQAAIESTQPKKEAPLAPISPESVQLNLSAGVSGIPPAKLQVLREILAAAGEPNAQITSFSRTAEEQARIMYNNIIKDGEARNRTSYKNPAAATVVVDAFMTAAKNGKSDAEVYAAVLAAVNQVGAANLSDHCGANPAIDIDPKSLKNSGNFESFLKKDARVKAICPPADPLYHIIVN